MAIITDPFAALRQKREQAAIEAPPLRKLMRAQGAAPAPAQDTLPTLLARLGLSLSDFVAFLVRVTKSPVWQGVYVDFEIKQNTDSVTVPHGLGHVHQGALVVLTMPITPRSAHLPVYVHPPTDDKNITFFVAAVASKPISCRAWVF